MYGCGNYLILIPFRLPQISCFTLSLKCFSSDSDNRPDVGIIPPHSVPLPTEGRPSPNTPVFPPSSVILQVLSDAIYSFLLVRYSCLLSAGVLHALLCLKLYSWCIHGEQCTPCPPAPSPSCSLPKTIGNSDTCHSMDEIWRHAKWNKLVIQFSHSRVWLFVAPWTAACQASLSITKSWSLFKFMSVKSVIPSSHLILYRSLLLLPSIFPSITVFSNESVLRIRWPKYWSFSFSISPSNEYSGLTSLRIDWLDLLAVQGKSLSRVSSKTTVQSIDSSALSFLYSPTLTSIHDYWKNHKLTNGPLLAK